jgi:hypothetical protein
LQPLVDALAKETLAAGKLHADETSVPVVGSEGRQDPHWSILG